MLTWRVVVQPPGPHGDYVHYKESAANTFRSNDRQQGQKLIQYGFETQKGLLFHENYHLTMFF